MRLIGVVSAILFLMACNGNLPVQTEQVTQVEPKPVLVTIEYHAQAEIPLYVFRNHVGSTSSIMMLFPSDSIGMTTANYWVGDTLIALYIASNYQPIFIQTILTSDTLWVINP